MELPDGEARIPALRFTDGKSNTPAVLVGGKGTARLNDGGVALHGSAVLRAVALHKELWQGLQAELEGS
jgi:hypothetical protein